LAPVLHRRGAGVEDGASKAGLAVILCNSDDQARKENRYLDVLEEHRVHGVLITPVVGASGVLQEMTRNHIRVLDDISIIGYDDIDFAAAAAVPLTSVRQPRQELGRTAARLLLEEAAADDTHRHRQVIFEPEPVVRQSTERSHGS
jgi:LacI family transcriptional regulator